jgi:hypothetical protein
VVTLGLTAFHAGQTAASPDLSGKWDLNLQKSKAAKKASVGHEKLVITQNGPNVEFDYDSDGKQSAETFVADKKEKVIRDVPAAGSQIMAKAYWKGTTLVIENWIQFKMSSQLGATSMMKTKDSWTLSADGLVLTDKYTSEDGQGLMVFDKQK